MEWILVVLYLVGGYAAMLLCTKQEQAIRERLGKYGNEAIRMYYNNGHYIASFSNPKMLVGNTIGIIIAIIALWPLVFGITAVWNQFIFIRIEKKYKKD